MKKAQEFLKKISKLLPSLINFDDFFFDFQSSFLCTLFTQNGPQCALEKPTVAVVVVCTDLQLSMRWLLKR